MLNTGSNQPAVSILIKALWSRLMEGLANRLEERRAQAELALMTPGERLGLDIMRSHHEWADAGRNARAVQRHRLEWR